MNQEAGPDQEPPAASPPASPRAPPAETSAPFSERAIRFAAELWRRVRARKVWQWGAGYVLAAYGVLQGITLIADTMGWPASVGRVALAALLTGFPIALIVAWHHGDRGVQRVTRAEAGLVGVCAAIGVALIVLVLQPGADGGRAATPGLPRLAVLRFESLGDTEPYFAEGVADELISEVSRVHGMEVTDRFSSFALTGERATPANATRELGASLVLTGSARKIDAGLRVQAQLVRAPGGEVLWDETFERPVAEIYALQRDIAVRVARAAGLQVEAPPPRRVDPEAFRLYLRGRELFITRVEAPGNLAQGRDMLRAAVERDPDFAEAWSWLSNAEFQMVSVNATPDRPLTREHFAAAIDAAEHVTALRPDWPDANETTATVSALFGQWREAAAASRAVEARGSFNYEFLMRTGQASTAASGIRREAALNPHNENTSYFAGFACLIANDAPCAVEAYRRTLEINPDHPGAPFYLFIALVRTGDRDGARRVLDGYQAAWRNMRAADATNERRYLAVLIGENPPVAADELTSIYRHDPALLSAVIWALALNGDAAEAAALLPDWSADDWDLAQLYDPAMAGMRRRPEFWALMQRKGLLSYWRETGDWPDFCAREPVCARYGRR